MYEEIGLPTSWARVCQAKEKSIAKAYGRHSAWWIHGLAKMTVWPEKSEGMEIENEVRDNWGPRCLRNYRPF